MQHLSQPVLSAVLAVACGGSQPAAKRPCTYTPASPEEQSAAQLVRCALYLHPQVLYRERAAGMYSSFCYVTAAAIVSWEGCRPHLAGAHGVSVLYSACPLL